MENEYKKHFANLKKNKEQSHPQNEVRRGASSRSGARFSAMKGKLNKGSLTKAASQKSARKGHPFDVILGLLAVAVTGGLLFFVVPYSEKFLNDFEVSFFGNALAKEESKEAKKSEKSAETKGKNEEKSAATKRDPAAVPDLKQIAAGDGESSYLAKLNERKKELDEREAELTKMEEELQAQRVEIDQKLKELEEIRLAISKKLDEKVQVDEEKVVKLVEVYKSMKPSDAAKVLEKLDENLAVEIFDRMKQSKAGEIMGFLNAEKARSISEKLTGYRRR